jgi:hypothetical protein
LGSIEALDSVVVHWPNGLIETWSDVDVDADLYLIEGTASCAGECPGCTYSSACNYDSNATLDDGSCDFSCFFNTEICGDGAVWNQESAQCEVSCVGDLNDDGTISVEDLLVLLAAFATECP